MEALWALFYILVAREKQRRTHRGALYSADLLTGMNWFVAWLLSSLGKATLISRD